MTQSISYVIHDCDTMGAGTITVVRYSRFLKDDASGVQVAHSGSARVEPALALGPDVTLDALIPHIEASLGDEMRAHLVQELERKLATKTVRLDLRTPGAAPELSAPTDAAHPVLTEQLVMDGLIFSTQAALDAFARTRSYDSILAACSYINSTVAQCVAEAQYAITARDQTWTALYAILDEITAGTRPMPSSFADISGGLPSLMWPV